MQAAIEDTPANRPVIQDWIAKWNLAAAAAVEAFAPIFDAEHEISQAKSFGVRYLDGMGLETLQIEP